MPAFGYPILLKGSRLINPKSPGWEMLLYAPCPIELISSTLLPDALFIVIAFDMDDCVPFTVNGYN